MHGRWDHNHSHAAPLGHNAPSGDAAQWQTPHLPEGGPRSEPENDEQQDLDLVEKAFAQGFVAANDPTSFLRLAGVPFRGTRADGTTLNLLRVEHAMTTDLGSLTPNLGGGSFRYDPLPERMVSRRDALAFVYHDGGSLVRLSLAEARALTSLAAD